MKLDPFSNYYYILKIWSLVILTVNIRKFLINYSKPRFINYDNIGCSISSSWFQIVLIA